MIAVAEWVQAGRLFCIFECVAALTGLAWAAVAVWTHRPDMPRKAFTAVSAGATAFVLLIVSVLFTEIGRFLGASKVTWRLPINIAGVGAVIAMVALFARSGFSPPASPAPGATRNPPLVTVVAVLFLLVTTASTLSAWQLNQFRDTQAGDHEVLCSIVRSQLANPPPVCATTTTIGSGR